MNATAWTYLRTLVPLMSALSYAESIAVNGDKADLTPVDRASTAVAAVDKSPGVSEGTHSRFVDLDTKIQQLHTHNFTTPQDAFNTFAAVTALALAPGRRGPGRVRPDPRRRAGCLLPRGRGCAADADQHRHRRSIW